MVNRGLETLVCDMPPLRSFHTNPVNAANRTNLYYTNVANSRMQLDCPYLSVLLMVLDRFKKFHLSDVTDPLDT